LETQWRPSCLCLRVKETDIVRKRPFFSVRWSEMIGDTVETLLSVSESETNGENSEKRWSEMIGDTGDSSMCV
jgi:hypothetical protein